MWSDDGIEYTEEQLKVHAELGMLANRILNMDVPPESKRKYD